MKNTEKKLKQKAKSFMKKINSVKKPARNSCLHLQFRLKDMPLHHILERKNPQWIPPALGKLFSQDPGCQKMTKDKINEYTMVKSFHLYEYGYFNK
ncbi:hypothetical protein LEMLEM_LOCUS6888 [Lemmus lemmus]